MKEQIQRIYLSGWNIDDFAQVGHGLLILEPLKPDAEVATRGGIVLPGQELGKIPGVAAFLFRVVARGERMFEAGTLAVDVGDVVAVRNAMVDTLHVNQALCVVHEKHVLARIAQKADPVVEEDPATVPRGVTVLKPKKESA